MMYRLHNALLFGLLFVLLLGPLPAAAQSAAPKAQLTLEDIHANGTFASRGFQGGRWATEGPVVYFVQPDQAQNATHLVSYNLESGTQSTLIDGAALYAADVGRLIRIENYQYSNAGDKVLIYTDSERVWRLNTKGYYYVYDQNAETLTPIADREAGFQMFAKFSPDGQHVAFVRDRNLFLVNLDTMEETALTTNGATGGLINGTSDWVYEEEFGLRDGWSWSPDSRHLAFFQLDETNTREFAMTDLRGFYPEYERFRYPKAGETNSEIRVGVIDITSESRVPLFFDTQTWNAGGEEFEYIPQMGWTPEIDGTPYVWMFRMNRDQNDLDVLYGNPATGDLMTVLEETEDTWIEVETGFSDLDVGQLTYLEDGEHFAWISERDGYRHLYLYKNDGDFVRQLTHGDWDVTDFHGIDEQRGELYFTAAKETPLERHLYRAPFNNSSATDTPMTLEKITEQAGWHGINMSGDLSYYIDSYSSATSPPVVSLYKADGSFVKLLENNERLHNTLAEYDLPAPEFFEVPGADGTMLNAWMIKPADFDPNEQYPMLMYVYGGPGSQTVRNQWGGTNYLWHQYLAQEEGVIVVSVDNRGTGARGKAFKSAQYKQMGVLEAQDQIAAAQHLGGMDFVDAGRIGIWGWSYGGFMTLNSLMQGDGPQTFKAGVSVAPVTHWKLYDTIYTERYMSTPQNNPEGYEAGSPLNYADRLQDHQKLLMVHGDFDDNVHFQNAVQMADALQAKNKQFEFMMYPGRNHGIYGGKTRIHLYSLMTNFVTEHLRYQPEPVNVEQASH